MINALVITFLYAILVDGPVDCTHETFRLEVCRGKASAHVFGRYVPAVRESRPPVILLHFTSGHSGNMLPAAAALAERGYPVYAIDWFYHGRTTTNRLRGVDSLAMIEDLIQMIQHRHGRQLIGIAGSSYGGDLAVLYALWEAKQCRETGRPCTVGSVVGQGLITHWQRGISGRFSIGLTLIHATEPAPIGLLMPPFIRTNWLFRLPQLYDSRDLRRQFRRDPLRVRRYPASLVVRVTRYRAALTDEPVWTPLLVLEGSRDRLVRPKYEQRVFHGLRRHMPNSEYHIVEGATHGMFEEHTAATVHEIDAWFQRSLPSGRRAQQAP